MEQTLRALKGMRLLKALGPDSFQSIFFKKTWEVKGQAVFEFVKGVMSGGIISRKVAEAFEVLIPKAANP